MSGLTDKVSGSAKEMAGEVTNNQELEAKGKLEQMSGEAKDKLAEVKDKAGEAANDLLDKAKAKLDGNCEADNTTNKN